VDHPTVLFQDLGAKYFLKMLPMENRMTVNGFPITREKRDPFGIEQGAKLIGIQPRELLPVVTNQIIVVTVFGMGCLTVDVFDPGDFLESTG
jgi:hypothetical protein